mmetsp:Transcript_42366/g.79389  ORF Transcript_42366/g.79389 Transcript_42366/m.79389 type:complete len:288 (-) Transcript_42366:18-881(-)
MGGSLCSAPCGTEPRPLSAVVGQPFAALVPPGNCVFGETWSPAKLAERVQLTHDTIFLTFLLPDDSKSLGLSTCACILCMFRETAEGDPIVRPYTPVSTNAMLGQFQLLVKVYPEGKMSQHFQTLPIGSDVSCKHITKNVKIQYPFGKKNIVMLVGGTGITPMVQALHAILGTKDDTSQVTLFFGNKTQKDILGRDLLDSWTESSAGRLTVIHVLSEAEDDSTWKGAKGFITREIIEQEGPPKSEEVLLMVCGPPAMYDALCGPRDKPELTGILADMGYSAEQVFKF